MDKIRVALADQYAAKAAQRTQIDYQPAVKAALQTQIEIHEDKGVAKEARDAAAAKMSLEMSSGKAVHRVLGRCWDGGKWETVAVVVSSE